MPKLSSRQASLYAALVFMLTIVLSFFLPHNPIALSGLLVVTFLSVFMPARNSTLLAGCASIAVVILFMVWHAWQYQLVEVWPELIFILILIIFSVLIVLYIKMLIRNIQFDKSHMTSLFENATEGIILTNSNADIVLINPAACKMFYYDAEELIGQKIELLLPKQSRSGHVHLRNGFYQHPQNRRMGSGRDLNGARKSGETFPVEVSLSSYEQNKKYYVIAFIVDITHRKQIERSMLQQQAELEKVSSDIRRLNTDLEAKVEERTAILKEALQRLELSQQELHEALNQERQLNEMKSRFVSMASHEFRTPLSAVLSSASLIAKYTTTEQQDARSKHINRIRDSVTHLNNLLEDFLSLGKLDEGKIAASFTIFDLPALVTDIIESMQGITKESQLVRYSHEGASAFYSDKNMIRNILVNLIGNAVKFSPAQSTIQVNTLERDEMVTLQVCDTGIGILKEDQQHLFSSFFRGKNAANIAGTGLGLHIVKRYADLLGGAISLESTPGKGTLVTIQFPKTNSHDQKYTGD